MPQLTEKEAWSYMLTMFPSYQKTILKTVESVNIIREIFCILIITNIIIFGSHTINLNSRETILNHLFLNLSVHQNHLKGLINYGLLDPTPQNSWFIRVGAESVGSLVMLILLAKKPYF